MLKVKGKSTASPFAPRSSPPGKVTTTLLVNKRMQADAAARPGSVAQFRLEPDMENASPPCPRNFSASSTKTVRSGAGSTSSTIPPANGSRPGRASKERRGSACAALNKLPSN